MVKIIFRLIKQVFVALMTFPGSLATKCMPLNNEPCFISPTLTDLNLVELNYYPFMISLDKCNGICNVADDSSTKICVPSKTKDVNNEVFNMTIIINEAKAFVNHISCDCKRKFNSTTFNSSQKWNNDKCQCECERYPTCIKDLELLLEY